MSHVRTDGAAVNRTAPGQAPPSPQQLEHEVEAQREELAATVHALSHKLDVKTQAGLKAEQVMDRATTPAGKPRPDLVAAVVGAAAAAVALIWWRRHR